jgi:ABC-type multidrug transport system permease subunit
MTFTAVIWKDWIIFKNKIVSNTLSAIIGPLLYLIAFGWGIGGQLTIDGISYIAFVIPGIAAMSAMSLCFGITANSINIARLYDKTFEAEMMSPVRTLAYTVAKIMNGALRGMYGAVLILAVSLLFDRSLNITPYFVLVMALHCCAFSAIGFIAGLKINSHADMAKVSNFIITPMSFLCGTLFPLTRFPDPLRVMFELLPLSQAVIGLRGGHETPGSWIPPVALAAWCVVMLVVSVKICRRTE